MAQLREIPLTLVCAHPLQPREGLDEETIASVCDAIAQAGGVYPPDLSITVRPRDDGGYEVLSGHHRSEAARRSKLTTVWAFVRPLSDRDAALYLAAANTHTVMSQVEHGRHAQMLKREYGVTFEAYAQAMGKSGSWVSICVAAAQVLDEYKGDVGVFAHLPATALAHAARIPDPFDRGQVLWALKDHRRPVAAIETAAKCIRNGEKLGPAIREGKRVMTLSDRVAEGYNNHARADLAAIGMRTSWQASVVEALTHVLEVRAEELEARKPDLNDPRAKKAFDDAVEARIRRERAAVNALEAMPC